MADAVLAACAASAYFASGPIDGSLFAGGGLYAMAPDKVALHEAEHFMGIDVARVRMLSVSTATVGCQPAEGVEAGLGIDIATPQAAKVLTGLAKQTAKALDQQSLKAFL